MELLTHGEWKFGHQNLQDEAGVVPLAFPLLAGPGALALVILSFETYGILVTVLSIIIVLGITYAILRLVEPIYRLLGKKRFDDRYQNICNYHSSLCNSVCD
jgi:multiple antibiotic resistance protein